MENLLGFGADMQSFVDSYHSLFFAVSRLGVNCNFIVFAREQHIFMWVSSALHPSRVGKLSMGLSG